MTEMKNTFSRRTFNKTAAVVGAGAALGAIPVVSQAAWPEAAFDAETIEGVLQSLYGVSEATPSDAINVKGPDIAENGAVVPVSIQSDIPNADSVALLVAKNPSPLASSFELANPGKVSVGTRIKMGETSELIALVRAEGKVYTATSKEVKVTIGGCGG